MRFLTLMLLSLLLVSCGETEKKRRTMGYKGEAKNNPFLAAQRYLRAEGKSVSSEHGLNHFDDSTAVIFLPPSSINTVGRAKRLLDWVEDGGHLVVMLDGGEKGGNDFRKNPNQRSVFDQELERPGVDYLLEQLDIGLEQRSCVSFDQSVDLEGMDVDEWEALEEKDRVLLGSEKSEIVLNGESLEIHHWANQGLLYDELYDGDYGSGGEASEHHRFLSVSHVHGRVSWLSDARPFRNRYIGYAEHARILNELVGLSGPGTIIFSSGEGDGLLSLLWRHFPLFIIALIIALGLWLWQHLPRFGPEQDVEYGGLREYSSQVRGIGRFLWHHKRDDVMLGALRASVNRGLSIQPGSSHEGIFDQLAERSGLPLESVIEAMTRINVRDPGTMVRVTQNLQTILTTVTNKQER